MRWLRFILSHSIFISICSVALVVQAFILYDQPVNISACALLFFLTLGSYNFYWLLSKVSFSGCRNLISHASNILLGVVALSGSLIILVFHPEYIRHLVIPVLLTILYSLPLWPVAFFQKLRKVGFMKTILLATAWSWNTLFLPLQILPGEINSSIMILFGARFFFMLMLCLIFDSRDAKIDEIHSLSSLATQLSHRQLSLFFMLTFLCFITMGFLFRIRNEEVEQVWAFAITGILTWVTYRMSLKPRSYYFYYFLVDGLMLISAIATIMASIL